MTETLEAFIEALRAQLTFDARAEATLEQVAAFARAQLQTHASAPHGPRARLRGCSLHWRGEQGYEGFVWRSEPGVARHSPGPSASLWTWMASERAQLVLEPQLELLWIDPRRGHQARRVDLTERAPHEPLSASMARFAGEESTHVLVSPLIDAHGSLVGMVGLEFEARSAMGDPALWTHLCPGLSVLLNAAVSLLAAGTPPPQTATSDELLPVIGRSMARRVQLLERFAAHDETLLLTGASGTGKSRLARWCHQRSARAEHPFEELDLLTVPEDMQMAQLVGWSRGAFTGAVQDVRGALDRADGGTLFIDEIDKLSLKTQAGFLKLLEDGTYQILGSAGGRRRANVRFIVATNADLQEAVRAGTFREDLLYRINTLPVHLPSLAERADEIPQWARLMLQRHSGAHMSWTPEALHLLERAPWPGNLRQLDNVVRRAGIIAQMRSDGHAQVTIRDVREALELGSSSPAEVPASLLHALEDASHLITEAALSLDEPPRQLLDTLGDALKALILRSTTAQLDGVEEAFRALGMEHHLAHRNHHRILKKLNEQLDQVRTLDEEMTQGG